MKASRPDDYQYVDMIRRNPDMPKNCEYLDVEEYAVTRPTVFCLSGNGAITTKEANGLCKQAEGYLKLMFNGKNVGKRVTDMVDLIGFKYARPKEDAKVGDLGFEFIEDFVNRVIIPKLLDKDGTRLSLDEACKNMSQMVFFTYCYGSQELNSIVLMLRSCLKQCGYLKFEIDEICKATQNISYAPFDNSASYIPSVRVISSRDDTVGEDIDGLLGEQGREDLDGIRLLRHDGVVENSFGETKGAERLYVLSSSLINGYASTINEHGISLITRDEDWNVKKYTDNNGNKYVSDNADCVSEMVAWALCRAVENAIKNSKSTTYIPSNFSSDLMQELQSIIDSYSSDKLEINPETKAQIRRQGYIHARSKELAKRIIVLDNFHENKSVIYEQLKAVKTFTDVVIILEKNNYYFVDELLPTIDFLTDAERTIITTIANCKSKEREEKEFSKKSFDEKLSLLKACTSFEEVRRLALLCENIAMDVLPWLVGLPDKKYPLTKEESKTILDEIKSIKVARAINKDRSMYDRMIDDCVGVQGLEGLVEVFNKYDFDSVGFALSSVGKGLTMSQTNAILDVSRAKRVATQEKKKMIEFPTYNQMVDMLNNADSLEEIESILKKYNYCGVDYILPEVIVLTDEEKDNLISEHGTSADRFMNND